MTDADRDDLAATLARASELEREIEELRRRNAEFDDANSVEETQRNLAAASYCAATFAGFIISLGTGHVVLGLLTFTGLVAVGMLLMRAADARARTRRENGERE